MKKSFVSSWNSSTQPRKQRKYRFNAPLHIKYKFLGSHLSKELRNKHSIRTIPVRKGDKVKVMRGQFTGKVGNIEKVNIKTSKVIIAGIDFTKKDGSKGFYPIHATNLLITDLNMDDKKRLKSKINKKSVKTPEKKIETKKVDKEEGKSVEGMKNG